MIALRACRTLRKAVEIAREELNNQNNNNDVNNDEPFTLADEDFVMTLMMDCLALLAGMQKHEQQLGIPKNNADSRMVRNKVFMGALSVVGKSLLKIDGTGQFAHKNEALNQLLGAFSVPINNKFFAGGGGKGWLPLHWAAVLLPLQQHNVTAADVETLYSLNPMAMQTKHVVDDDLHNGATPAHLLCMSPVTPISMQLVRSISLCCPAAFGSVTTVSALRAACRYGSPTVEVLQHLLQLDSSQTEMKVTFRFQNHFPLGQLCFNLMMRADELPNADDLMNCLLLLENSMEVVEDAVISCLRGYESAGDRSEDKATVDKRNGRLYGLMTMLLKANPEAAKYRNSSGRNLLLWLCGLSLPSKLCIDLMKLVLAVHKDAAQEAGSDGWLPAHRAAYQCDLEVLEFLLGVYPQAASAVTSVEENLLHLAVGDKDPSRAVSKVQYLCARYPAMIQQKNNNGNIPVHAVAARRYEAMLALYEAGGAEQFKMPIAHPTDANYALNGFLPLHLFMIDLSLKRKVVSHGTISVTTDMFRWLLHLYPEAAGIDASAQYKKTPYQMAVDYKLPDYYLRLLLRAAPTLNPAELHRLNYEERRGAMFLAFKAISRTLQAPLLVRLRGESKDLVQRVVSFL